MDWWNARVWVVSVCGWWVDPLLVGAVFGGAFFSTLHAHFLEFSAAASGFFGDFVVLDFDIGLFAFGVGGEDEASVDDATEDDKEGHVFDDNVYFESREVDAEHDVDMVERCCADHDEGGEHGESGEGNRVSAPGPAERVGEKCEAAAEEDNDSDDEDGLDDSAVVVPALRDGHSFAVDGDKGLKVELFVDAEDEHGEGERAEEDERAVFVDGATESECANGCRCADARGDDVDGDGDPTADGGITDAECPFFVFDCGKDGGEPHPEGLQCVHADCLFASR